MQDTTDNFYTVEFDSSSSWDLQSDTSYSDESSDDSESSYDMNLQDTCNNDTTTLDNTITDNQSDCILKALSSVQENDNFNNLTLIDLTKDELKTDVSFYVVTAIKTFEIHCYKATLYESIIAELEANLKINRNYFFLTGIRKYDTQDYNKKVCDLGIKNCFSLMATFTIEVIYNEKKIVYESQTIRNMNDLYFNLYQNNSVSSWHDLYINDKKKLSLTFPPKQLSTIFNKPNVKIECKAAFALTIHYRGVEYKTHLNTYIHKSRTGEHVVDLYDVVRLTLKTKWNLLIIHNKRQITKHMKVNIKAFNKNASVDVYDLYFELLPHMKIHSWQILHNEGYGEDCTIRLNTSALEDLGDLEQTDITSFLCQFTTVLKQKQNNYNIDIHNDVLTLFVSAFYYDLWQEIKSNPTIRKAPASYVISHISGAYNITEAAKNNLNSRMPFKQNGRPNMQSQMIELNLTPKRKYRSHNQQNDYSQPRNKPDMQYSTRELNLTPRPKFKKQYPSKNNYSQPRNTSDMQSSTKEVNLMSRPIFKPKFRPNKQHPSENDSSYSRNKPEMQSSMEELNFAPRPNFKPNSRPHKQYVPMDLSTKRNSGYNTSKRRIRSDMKHKNQRRNNDFSSSDENPID